MAENIAITYSVGPGEMIFLANLVREGAALCHEGAAQYYRAVCKSVHPDVHLRIEPAPDAGENWVSIKVLTEFRVVLSPTGYNNQEIRFVVVPAGKGMAERWGQTLFTDWVESADELKRRLLKDKTWARNVYGPRFASPVVGYTAEEFLAASS